MKGLLEFSRCRIKAYNSYRAGIFICGLLEFCRYSWPSYNLFLIANRLAGAGIIALCTPLGINWGHEKLLGLFSGLNLAAAILVNDLSSLNIVIRYLTDVSPGLLLCACL